jgi:hypothetical protein
MKNDEKWMTLIEHWDGKVWSVVPSGSQGGGILNAISAASPDDIWAVGTATVPNTVVTLHWDGSKWSDFARGVVRDGFAIRSDGECEHEALSRRVAADIAPRELLARAVALEPDAADRWLDRRVDEGCPRERVCERPPRSEARREGLERARRTSLHHLMMRNLIARHHSDLSHASRSWRRAQSGRDEPN